MKSDTRNETVQLILEDRGFVAGGGESASDMAHMIEEHYLSFGQIRLGLAALIHQVMCYLLISDYEVTFHDNFSHRDVALVIATHYAERERTEKSV